MGLGPPHHPHRHLDWGKEAAQDARVGGAETSSGDWCPGRRWRGPQGRACAPARGSAGGRPGEGAARPPRTFSLHFLMVVVSSLTTISTHLILGSLSFCTCFFTVASKARSGVKRPVLHPGVAGWGGERSSRRAGGGPGRSQAGAEAGGRGWHGHGGRERETPTQRKREQKTR